MHICQEKYRLKMFKCMFILTNLNHIHFIPFLLDIWCLNSLETQMVFPLTTTTKKQLYWIKYRFNYSEIPRILTFFLILVCNITLDFFIQWYKHRRSHYWCSSLFSLLWQNTWSLVTYKEKHFFNSWSSKPKII